MNELNLFNQVVVKALDSVLRLISELAAKRVERKDCFAATIRKAMHFPEGTNLEDVSARLVKRGFGKQLAERAAALAHQHAGFTLFGLVAALPSLP